MRALPALLFAVASLTASAANLNSIPEPRPGAWIVDTTGRIPASDVSAANALSESVHSRRLGDVGVVIVDTTGGMGSRSFAESLHNRFHLGTGRGDGILFFVALNDRKAEILLPYGLRTAADQSRSDQAMSTVIVPSFKAGNPGGAIREGTRALVQLLENSPLNGGAKPPKTTVVDQPQDTHPVRNVTSLPMSRSKGFVVDDIHVLTAGETEQIEEGLNRLYADGKARLYLYLVDTDPFHLDANDLATAIRNQLQTDDAHPVQVMLLSSKTTEVALVGEPLSAGAKGWATQALLEEVSRKVFDDKLGDAATTFASRYEKLANGGPDLGDYGGRAWRSVEDLGSVILGFGFFWVPMVLIIGVVFIPRYLRNRPRKCKTCGDPRMRLNEMADDAYLSPGQKDEERLESVDYDVWWCARCSDALVLRYRKWFSGYCRCPSCDFIVAIQTTTTIRHATYSSGGEVQIDLDCTRCNHHESRRRYTPRLQRSSSSSSSWSSGSSFGSSSRGGGGGSFGGSSGSW